jgi:hypothetical protein
MAITLASGIYKVLDFFLVNHILEQYLDVKTSMKVGRTPRTKEYDGIVLNQLTYAAALPLNIPVSTKS